jgi:hypothetical protein
LPINMHPHISSIASIASVIDEERWRVDATYVDQIISMHPQTSIHAWRLFNSRDSRISYDHDIFFFCYACI